MKKNLKLVGAVILGLTWTSALFAGNAIFNFDQDPGNDLALNRSIIIGNHNYTTPLGFSQLWCSGGADPSLNPATGTNGNPNTGGYLSICDGTNINNGLVFVFPDIDNGLPIKGFQIDMDMRVGNGSLGRPADGFSVSFTRAGDIALVNATNGVIGGFAGGDGSVAAAQSPLGSGDVENGTKTGVSVVFDSWQGNYLPDTPPFSTANAATDREGIAVRVDDHTLIQLDLVNNRNETDCINAQGISTKQTTLNNNGTGLSMQTGTNAPILTRDANGCPLTYGATDTSGSFTNLFWAHLMVRLTNNPNPNLTVIWKGVQVVNTNLNVFAASVGRLVLAGRCGANNQNVHVDNIVVSTTPTTNTFLAGIQGLLNGFVLTVSDNGPAIVQRYDKILLDGSDVTAQTVSSYSAPYLTGTYQQATRFAANSFHTVTATWVDNYNITNNGSLGFVVANYTYFPTNFALPFSAVDQTKRGFLVNSYQSFQNNPNQARWNEEQILGLHGNNVVGAGTAAKSGDYFVWDGALGFINTLGVAPGGPGIGFFTGTYPTADDDLAVFGISQNYPANPGAAGQGLHGNYDNCALEIFSYVYFPTSGVYNMVIGNDDSFQVSVSQNPLDRMGNVVWYNNGTRLPNLLTAAGAPTIADIRTVIIDQAGVYPIRILWDNGGGGAVEWEIYQRLPNGGVAQMLIGDTNTPGAIQAFQFSSAETPYVEYSSLFPPATLGNSRPVTTLSGNSAAATAANPGPVQQDFWWGLVNGPSTSINTSLPITLSLNGFVMPVDVAPSTSNNWLIVSRPATNSTWWPSGQLGPLLLNFTDSSARQVSLNLGTFATPFWGTLTNPIPITRIDTNTPGIKVRTYAADPFGSQGIDTRVHAAEQILAGLWGSNTINAANNVAGHPLVGGYYTYPTTNNTSTVVSNGVVNFDYAGPDGDFQPAGFPEVRWPGIPNNNTVGNKTDNFMAEILAVVEFPTNGNYMLGVSSDDGFRLTKGWTPPANNGAMVVNSPPAVAGPKATVTDTSFASTLLTVPITANLALAQGIATEYGSTTNGEGCVINNDLTGKIALIYRSAFCGYPQQVLNAFNAHALAVVFVQNPAANRFPQEPGVSPPVGIPAVEVSAAVGNALNASLATNGTVNVTLSGMDYVANPPPSQSPLGQADIGKGAGDILFPVVVQQAGLYPLRLIWFQGGGGANCEFSSVTGGNRVLINDLTKTTGPGPNGTGLRAWFGMPEAKMVIVNNGNGTVTLTFTGFLQAKSNLGDVWADYPGNPTSPLTIPASQVNQFFRSRF